MLGLGRALGETMAVAMVLSPRGVITFVLTSSTNPSTIAANIALNFPEAHGIDVNVLIATGLILFVITLAGELDRPLASSTAARHSRERTDDDRHAPTPRRRMPSQLAHRRPAAEGQPVGAAAREPR